MVQDGAVLDASRNPIVDLLTGALLISLGLPSLSPKIVAWMILTEIAISGYIYHFPESQMARSSHHSSDDPQLTQGKPWVFETSWFFLGEPQLLQTCGSAVQLAELETLSSWRATASKWQVDGVCLSFIREHIKYAHAINLLVWHIGLAASNWFWIRMCSFQLLVPHFLQFHYMVEGWKWAR